MDNKIKIIVFDDCYDDSSQLKDILSSLKIEFSYKSTFDGFCKVFKEGNYSLVIIHSLNPEIEGIRIIKWLISNPSDQDLPILFYRNSYTIDESLVNIVKSGQLNVIILPIVPEILMGRINLLIENQYLKQKLSTISNVLYKTNIELIEAQTKTNQADYTKSLFLSNISHEIRTPLNGILGMANVLAETSLNEEQISFLNMIQISGENLLLIINDILDFAKIESGQISIENVHFNLQTELKTVMSLMLFNCNDKSFDLKYTVAENINGDILGDPLRLKQILINLISNAIKFTDKGSITVKVDLNEDLFKQTFIKFSVIDTGIGIDTESKEKIFKEFNQLDNSITRKFGGTGLGLAICKSLVNLMGGRIGLESEQGKGSTFWFEIPYFSEEIANQSIGSIKSSTFNVSLNILVAEDNPINQKVSIHSLRLLGFKCDLAKNGKQAVELHFSNKYDVIFMDIQMPELDGLEATKMIRNHEKLVGERNPVIIVAATANAFNEDKKKCLAAGMNYHLSKPFRPEELKKMIEIATHKANNQ